MKWREPLTERGVGVSGMNAMQIVGLAFTHSSSDFGSILLDVAHKSIIKGWEEHIEDFDKFTTKGVLTDFRPAHRVGMGEFGLTNLDKAIQMMNADKSFDGKTDTINIASYRF